MLERYRAGIAQVQKGQFADALDHLPQRSPPKTRRWRMCGAKSPDWRCGSGRNEEALAAYKQVVTVAPHDPGALVSVADTLLKLGRLDEARAQASPAADIIPASEVRWRARAHQTLTMIALARHDQSDARAEAAKAHDIDPSLPMPQYVEGLVRYNAGEFDAAIPFLQQALKQGAASTVQVPELRYYLGDALARSRTLPRGGADPDRRDSSLPVQTCARARRWRCSTGPPVVWTPPIAPSTRSCGSPPRPTAGRSPQALADVWGTRQGAGGGRPSAMSVTMTVPSVAMKHLASIAALGLFATSAALAQSSAQAPPADPQSPDRRAPVFRTGSSWCVSTCASPTIRGIRSPIYDRAK